MTTVETLKQKRWEGTVKLKINGVSPDRAWPFLADFFNWELIFPTMIESSIEIEGISGMVGCVRKVMLKPEASLGWEGKYSRWGLARLADIDHTRKWLKYEVLENTFGLDNYEATMSILPLEGTIEDSEYVWSFALDPPKDGRSLEAIITAYEATLALAVSRLEELCGVSK